MWSESDFPKLKQIGFAITSKVTNEYNCIAWAAGSDDRWWWPDPMYLAYWPPGVSREETLAAFVQAYETLGYELCEHGELEQDYEKIAIYALGNGIPTHAARQLCSGMWTSKLGTQEDIEHALEGLEGPVYGSVVRFLKREL